MLFALGDVEPGNALIARQAVHGCGRSVARDALDFALLRVAELPVVSGCARLSSNAGFTARGFISLRRMSGGWSPSMGAGYQSDWSASDYPTLAVRFALASVR